jgi:hypothetical protein
VSWSARTSPALIDRDILLEQADPSQALAHPQAYKPYSPRIPHDEEIPLHHHKSPETRLSSDPILAPAADPRLQNSMYTRGPETNYDRPYHLAGPQDARADAYENRVRVSSQQRDYEERQGLESEDVETVQR